MLMFIEQCSSLEWVIVQVYKALFGTWNVFHTSHFSELSSASVFGEESFCKIGHNADGDWFCHVATSY